MWKSTAGNDVWAPAAVEVFLCTKLNGTRGDRAGSSEVIFFFFNSMDRGVLGEL